MWSRKHLNYSFVVATCCLCGSLAFSPSFHRLHSQLPLQLQLQAQPQTQDSLHLLDEIVCNEQTIALPHVGEVTILQVTEESQDKLDHMAMSLALNLDDLNNEDSQQQVLKEGDIHGATLWPSSSAVAKYLLKDETLDLSSTSVVELGAGSGLVSIAAALQGASVIATDFEPFPLTMAQYSASKFHGINLETQLFDLCASDNPLPDANVIVAADINYEPETAIALADRTAEALAQGSRVIIGDSPGRAGRPFFLDKLKKLGVSDVPVIDSNGVTTELGEAMELPVFIMDMKPQN